MLTCATVEVLVVDNQTGSEGGVVHLVAVRVQQCFIGAADRGTVYFLSSVLRIPATNSHIHTHSHKHTL